MIKRLSFLLLLGAACALSACPASAAVTRIVAEADSFLSNDTNRGPEYMHGGTSSFDVRWYDVDGTQRIRIGIARWDISEIPASEYDAVSLQLGLRKTSGVSALGMIDVYGLDDDVVTDRLTGRFGNDWDELTINYLNAPGVDNAAALGTFSILPDETQLLGSIPLPEPGYISNPVDLPLGDFLREDTDNKVTLLLMSPEADGYYHRVRARTDLTQIENGSPPPTLRYGTVPEPGAVVLLLMGLVGPLACRRR